MNDAITNSVSRPRTILILGIVLVAFSTAALPSITGYGTSLFQVVGLVAWKLVAAFTSGAIADQHHAFVWSVAAFLNVALFGLPASAVFWFLRKRAPKLCIFLLGAWLVFYFASLFVLFPATDGP